MAAEIPTIPPDHDLLAVARDVLNRLGPILNAVAVIRMAPGKDPEPCLRMIVRRVEEIRRLLDPRAAAGE